MSLRHVGYVVGESDSSKFIFVSDLESFPPRHEYLVIQDVRERNSDEFNMVQVLAQVTRIANYSDILGDNLSLRELESIISRYDGNTKVYGEAKVLGYMNNRGEVMMPRSATVPGQRVYRAPTEMLEHFFTQNVHEVIPVGGLITRQDVQVSIDPNGFRRHVAIIAQTGAGKSYLVGLILERLLPLGATIIVFDPNSDYVMMRRRADNTPTEIAEDTTIYRPPGIERRRHTDAEIGGSESFTINFSALMPEEVLEVAGISSRWVHLVGAVRQALGSLSGLYGPQQLVEALEALAQSPSDPKLADAAGNALPYVRRLTNYPIWGNRNIPVDEILAPNHMSVIDLAGLQKRVSEYVVSRTLSEVWARAITGGLEFPVFVVLEEAHNFAPAQGQNKAASSEIIERISAEGRKFGIFLTVVTQRPGKVSSNVLSQCNSQIIMRLTNPEDMSAVRSSSEALGEDLFQDLPGLNRGEAVIVGELTRVPTMVHIQGRESGEGGSDIDVINALHRARERREFNAHAHPAPDGPDPEPNARW